MNSGFIIIATFARVGLSHNLQKLHESQTESMVPLSKNVYFFLLLMIACDSMALDWPEGSNIGPRLETEAIIAAQGQHLGHTTISNH